MLRRLLLTLLTLLSLSGACRAAAPTVSWDDVLNNGQNLGSVSYNGTGVTSADLALNTSAPRESVVLVVYLGRTGTSIPTLSELPHSAKGVTFQSLAATPGNSSDGNAYSISAYSANTSSAITGDNIHLPFTGTVNVYQISAWGFVNSNGATPSISGTSTSLLTSNQPSYTLLSNLMQPTQWAQHVYLGPFGTNQSNTGNVSGYIRQLGGIAGTANGFLSSRLLGGTQSFTIPTCQCDTGAFTRKTGFVSLLFDQITVVSIVTDFGGITFSHLTPTSVTATGTDATGGLLPYTYQWTQNGVNVGTNSLTLNATGLTPGQTYSFALTISDQVGQSVTLPATISTPSVLVSGVASASNVTSTSATLTVTPATTGTAPYAYQWRKNGVNVGGATGVTYNAAGLTPGTGYTFDCIVTDAAGQTAGSNVVGVTTTSPLVSGTASASSITATSAALTVTIPTSGIAPYTYQWKQNGTPIAGATTPTYHVTGLTPGTSYTFAVVTTDAINQTATSNDVPVTTVTSLVAGTASASNVTTTTADLAVTTPTTGLAPYTYQWQVNGADVDGATNATFEATGLTPGTGYQFDCIVHDAIGQSATSNTVDVTTVTTLVSGTASASNVTTTTADLAVTAPATGVAPYSYQWQVNGADVDGATNANFDATGLTPGTGYQFDCVVHDAIGQSATSNIVEVTTVTTLVSGTASASNVTTTTADLTVTAATTGLAPYSYQWQVNGADVDGATNATFDATGLTPGTSYQFDCVVHDAIGQSATSNTVDVTTVTTLVSGTASASNVTTTTADLAVTAPATGIAPYTYQWLEDDGSGFQPISGATTANYTVAGLNPGDVYHFEVTTSDAVGQTATSNAVEVDTITVLVAGTVAVSSVNTDTAVLTTTAPTTGASPYTYQWQKAEDIAGTPGVFTDIGTGGTTSTVDGLIPGKTYWFRAIDSDSIGQTAASNQVSVTTTDLLWDGTLTSTDITTVGAKLTIGDAIGGTPPVLYQFQQAGDVAGSPGAFVNVGGVLTGGIDTLEYDAQGLAPGTCYWYRVLLTDSTSPNQHAISNVVKISTTPPPSFPTAPYALLIDSVRTVVAVTETGGTGPITYQWQRAIDDGHGNPGDFSNIGSAGTALYLNDNTVAGGNTYWYRVTATDVKGIAATSTPSTVTIP